MDGASQSVWITATLETDSGFRLQWSRGRPRNDKMDGQPFPDPEFRIPSAGIW
jgi:hypothetical protein